MDELWDVVKTVPPYASPMMTIWEDGVPLRPKPLRSNRFNTTLKAPGAINRLSPGLSKGMLFVIVSAVDKGKLQAYVF
jgi:hypothetical protein